MSDTILILDFGSQFTQLIARKVREAGVYSEICSCAISLAAIQEYQPKGIILSGGPESIYKKGAPTIAKELLEVGVPILGICYGMHALAQCFSATISAASRHEYGDTTIRIECTSPLFAGIKNKAGNNPLLSVWMSHGDQILRLPNGFNIIAASDNCLIAGFENVEKKIYAVQFHPEVSHTEQGITIIHNFINICNCKKNSKHKQSNDLLIFSKAKV